MKKQIYAFDRSVRSVDADGRLHVSLTNISKAMVCPYLGKEIPDHAALGLDPGRIYHLLRDPGELAKGAETFRNLPLLIQHVPVSADKPRKDLVVGSTGSDVTFRSPYLQCSLSVWDSAAIAGIETKDQTELSAAYRYRPDMTPGEFEGVEYDGIMRDIIGNHVALVDVGRAGHDVVVADRNPFIGSKNMKKKLLLAALEGFLAQDADLVALDGALSELIAQDEEEKKKDEPKAKPAEDEDDDEYEDDPDNPGKRRKKVAQDEDTDDEPKKPEVTKAAMDSAIKLAADTAKREAKAEMEQLFTARKEVLPLVGEVAMDSAEEVYKFALDHAKIDVKGIHPSAYRALVKMHLSASQQKQQRPVAMDAKTQKEASEKFPNIARFKQA